MFFPPRSVESPYRFAQHLPDGIEAASLEQAMEAMQQKFGEPDCSGSRDELTESLFELEDRDVLFYALGSTPIAIASKPKPAIKGLLRPCSGPAGRLTGTGSATGCLLFYQGLYLAAEARAFMAFARLYPAASRVCAPCVCVPFGPIPSATRVAPAAGILGITVSVDVTAQLFCI